MIRNTLFSLMAASLASATAARAEAQVTSNLTQGTVAGIEVPSAEEFLPGASDGNPYSKVQGVYKPAEFEARVDAFRKAVFAGDKAVVSQWVHFPMKVNSSAGTKVIRDPGALKASWDRTFTMEWTQAVAAAGVRHMEVRDGTAVLGEGLARFDKFGLVEVDLPAATLSAK